MNDNIKQKLKILTTDPGVYIMKDASGLVIYVGKAIVLKNRVLQYFRNFDSHGPKVRAMISHIDDFDYIVCKSEMEALILESNLIKKHMPKYNILLKDDKHYPYVRIDFSKDFPLVQIVRKVKNDGGKYYGPFLNASNLRDLFETLSDTFPLRTCKKDIKKAIARHERPCINYQIGRCIGPCTGRVTKSEYHDVLNNLALFLQGKYSEIISILKTQMEKAAKELAYEKAAKLRDSINLIEKAIQTQRATAPNLDDRDVLGIALADDIAIIQQLFMRSGKMIGSETFHLEIKQEETQEDILSAFVMQYYDTDEKIPKEVLLPITIDGMEIMEQRLRDIKGGAVSLHCPIRGDKKAQVVMANKNANENILKQKQDRQWQKTVGASMDLAKAIGIEGPIHRMECYDISNIQGTDSVGSMVVFIDGKPRKDQYRRFKIKTVEGPNDFASMEEVLTRRFLRLIDEQQQGIDGQFSEIPDLLVVDGGKGQLSSGYAVLERLNLTTIPIIGLAKREEEVFLPHKSEPININKNSNPTYLLQRIRDEAHRFAITFHKSLRGKRSVHSILDDISGVGPARKKALINGFKTISNIKKAKLEELEQIVDIKTAKQVFDFFNSKENQ